MDDRCSLCGTPIVTGVDEARLPGVFRPSGIRLHAHCYRRWHEDGQRRADAWAKSLRGRLWLATRRVRLVAFMVGAALLSLIGAAPIAVYRAIRGWRLRRCVNRLIGPAAGLVLVGVVEEASVADEVSTIYSEAWASVNSLVLHRLDSSSGRSSDPIDARIWSQWPPNQKVAMSGVIFVPRRGRVASWTFSTMHAARSRADAAGAARRAIEARLRASNTSSSM